jgi:hypothetical protein
MDRTMIDLSVPNTISILIMAALGYGLLSIIMQLIRGRLGMKGGSASNSNTPGGTSGAFAGVFGSSLFKQAA